MTLEGKCKSTLMGGFLLQEGLHRCWELISCKSEYLASLQYSLLCHHSVRKPISDPAAVQATDAQNIKGQSEFNKGQLTYFVIEYPKTI